MPRILRAAPITGGRVSKRFGALPPFFDGVNEMALVALASKFGWILLSDLASMCDLKHNSADVREIAMRLAERGIVRVTEVELKVYARVEPWHPAYSEIVALGGRIYDTYYLERLAQVGWERRPVPARDMRSTRHHGVAPDLAVLDASTAGRILHLVAACGSVMPSELSRALAIRKDHVADRLHFLQAAGLVKKIARNKASYFALLSTAHPVHPELIALMVRIDDLRDGHYAHLARRIVFDRSS